MTDITAPNCSLSRVGNWPSDRRDETLKWATNAGALGPHYRVFTKEEVKVVKTGQKYECENKVDNTPMKKSLS